MRNSRLSGHVWLLVPLLVSFFFIYQVALIYSVMVMDCTPMDQLWLTERRLGFNPFTLFALVFVLFGLWALFEVAIAWLAPPSELWPYRIISLLVVLSVIAILAALRTQWEYFQVQWGQRNHQDFTFALIKMPEQIYKNQWYEFLTELRCEDPSFFESMDSEEAWYQLETLFLEERNPL